MASGTPIEAWSIVRDIDFSSIELELFREFERSELRRLETRRGQGKRPRTPPAVVR